MPVCVVIVGSQSAVKNSCSKVQQKNLKLAENLQHFLADRASHRGHRIARTNARTIARILMLPGPIDDAHAQPVSTTSRLQDTPRDDDDDDDDHHDEGVGRDVILQRLEELVQERSELEAHPRDEEAEKMIRYLDNKEVMLVKALQDKHGLDMDEYVSRFILPKMVQKELRSFAAHSAYINGGLKCDERAKQTHRRKRAPRRFSEQDEEAAGVDVLTSDAWKDLGDLGTASNTVYRLFSEQSDIKRLKQQHEANCYDDSALGGDVPEQVFNARVDDIRIAPDIEPVLLPHQREAVVFLYEKLAMGRGGLLLHHMGLGKMLTMLSLIHSIQTNTGSKVHCIFAVPKSVIEQVGAEIIKWPMLALNYFTVKKKQDFEAQVPKWLHEGGLLIVGHHQLLLNLEQLVEMKAITDKTVICLDESHLFKSKNNQFYSKLKSLPTQLFIGSTGSPMQNNIADVYNLADLSFRGILGQCEADFMKAYGDEINRSMYKQADEHTLKQGKIKITALMEQLESNGIAHIRTAAFLKQSLHLEQYRVGIEMAQEAPTKISGNAMQFRSDLSTLSREDKCAFIKYLRQYMDRQGSHGRIAVFSEYTTVLRHFASSMPSNSWIVTGEESVMERHKRVVEFSNSTCSSQTPIIFLSVRAMGVGVNLQAANVFIMAEPSWNPVHREQALARLYRAGQRRPVIAFDLVAEYKGGKGSFETHVYKTQVNKHIMNAKVMGKADDLEGAFTKDEMAVLTRIDQVPIASEKLDNSAERDLVLFAAQLCTLYDHTELVSSIIDIPLNFADLFTAVYFAARMEAQNTHFATRIDGKQELVGSKDTTFADGTSLVQACTPYCDFDDDKILCKSAPYIKGGDTSLEFWVDGEIIPANEDHIIFDTATFSKVQAVRARVVKSGCEPGNWSKVMKLVKKAKGQAAAIK